jgi:hypothetical protein
MVRAERARSWFEKGERPIGPRIRPFTVPSAVLELCYVMLYRWCECYVLQWSASDRHASSTMPCNSSTLIRSTSSIVKNHTFCTLLPFDGRLISRITDQLFISVGDPWESRSLVGDSSTACLQLHGNKISPCPQLPSLTSIHTYGVQQGRWYW